MTNGGPGTATEPRARLGQKLAEVTPGDINTFFFTLGGAEANENALKMAKAFTGRSKILARIVPGSTSVHHDTFVRPGANSS